MKDFRGFAVFRMLP